MGTNLNQFVLDPSKVVNEVINAIESSSNGELVLTDPTNPFINLIEISSTLTAIAINEHNINTRSMFPVLAVNTDDIYKHISDDDIIGITSIPSTVNMVFGVKKIDVLHLGVKMDGYTKASIPVNTNINIDNIDFTLLNRIDIIIYDSGEISIEQEISENGLGVDYLYILDNYIENDIDSVEWIVFQTIAKQIKREVFRESIISSKKFEYIADIDDKFFFTEVYAVNKDNSRIKLEIVYNDTVFDLNTPSIYVKFLDGKIGYEIPMIYQANGLIDNVIEIVLMTTKGYLNIPIELLTSSQFLITLGDTLDLSSAAMKNINKYAVSRGMLSNGTNGKSIEEIKTSVINNTIGKIDTAITIQEKKEQGAREGFEISLAKDTTTKRTFIATKNLPEPTVDNINVRADLFMDSVSFVLDDISNKSRIGIHNENIIIKSRNLFRFSNGMYEILSDTDVYNISIMPKKDLMNYLNNNVIIYNPFYYVIEKNYNTINSRVYDLDNPYLSELKVIAKNTYVSPRTNIVAMDMSLVKDGYKIIFQVTGNDSFLALRTSFVYCQLKLKLNNSIETVTFVATMQKSGDVNYFEFNIKSNFYIDSDSAISISGGASLLTTKSISISDTIDIIIYTLDPLVQKDAYHPFYDSYVDIEDKEKLNVLTLEQVKYRLGQELKYLWNDVRNFYTNKKFKRYEEDEYARYPDNVYEYNPETQGIYWYIKDIDSEEVVDVETRLIHSKGDIIVDDYGNNIYAHRAGDYVVDEYNNLIIDGTSGIIRAVDILLIDYKFIVANNNYPNYVKEYIGTIVNTWLNSTITNLNKDSLEQTTIYYKPSKSLSSVKAISNNLVTNFDSIVTPIVTLYNKSNAALSADNIKTFKDIIGKIIHKHIEQKEIILSKIKEEIMSVLGSTIVGVKIENITSDNREYIKIDNTNSNTFSLNKKLFLDNNNLLDLNYDINLIVESNI